MYKWLRRVRGAVGIGLAWGAAWFGAGMVILLGLLITTGSTGADVPYPLGFGLLGFIAGVTFSGVLGLTEGRRRFDQMSLPRFAGWGAVGGFLFAALFVVGASINEGSAFLGNLVFLGPLFALAGSACAAGSLAIARKGEEPILLDPGADPGEIELGKGQAENHLEAEE